MLQDCICGKLNLARKHPWVYSFFIFFCAVVFIQSQVIYQTGFEPEEGYDLQYTLAEQSGWQADGTSGNGLIKDTFQDLGNQAYIGFWPPQNDDEGYINIWRPIESQKTDNKIIRFSVVMMIADSEDTQRDEFRWIIYNSETKWLASVNFDNHTKKINYELDDGEGPKDTEFIFERNTIYDLTIDMNFHGNNWAAKIGDVYIIENQPLTTSNAKLELGVISAAWVFGDIGNPGNNFMVFDDYKIEQATEAVHKENSLHIKIKNELPVITFSSGKYILESSSNLIDWQDIFITNGESNFVDKEYNKKKSQRFYRLRLIE
ncbi:MAG: hypothetical protein VYB35_05450 [Verrucomicrobiota bacterium]|nr:hypothetical protein [Verrucomicrobiota bacterium]